MKISDQELIDKNTPKEQYQEMDYNMIDKRKFIY